ncbi:MAG: glycoside hydrolase domain-containing protein [Mycobacteriales bacterium]
MSSIYNDSAFNVRNFGAYLGGETAGAESCFVPPASWYAAQFQIGWQISLIYDGVQDPCTGNAYTFPLNDPSDDYIDGQNAGYNAEDAATALGFTNAPVFLWYDLDPYNTGDSACVSAAQSFMQGYTSTMGSPSIYEAGFYGAASGSDPMAMLNVSPHPAYYWLAYYDGNPDVYDMGGYIPTTIWVNNQRMKQWFGNPPDGYTSLGGVNYNLDKDCSQTYVQSAYAVSVGC